MEDKKLIGSTGGVDVDKMKGIAASIGLEIDNDKVRARRG